MVDFAYSYKALDARRQKVDGVVLASDSDHAIYRLKLVELRDITVSVDAVSTVRGWFTPNFSPKELALFYRTLADRMQTDLALVVAIGSSSEFLSDPRLRQAVRMAALTAGGAKLHDALKTAGFPRIDCSLLEAVKDSGETVETLKAMADRLDREAKLKRNAIVTMLPTLGAMALIFAFFWYFILFLAPNYQRYFTDRNLFQQMTPWVRAVYRFAALAASQRELFTLGYIGTVIGLVFLAKTGRLTAFLTLIPSVKQLVIRWDHMRAWSAFRVMLRADMGLPRICRMLAEASSLPEMRDQFTRGSRMVDNGSDLPDMVQRVGFPDYVIRYIKTAAPGKLEDALKRLVQSLDSDTEILAARVQLTTTLIGFSIAAVAIFFAFRVTYIENFILFSKLV